MCLFILAEKSLAATEKGQKTYEKYSVEEPNRLTKKVFHEPMLCHFLINNEDHCFLL